MSNLVLHLYLLNGCANPPALEYWLPPPLKKSLAEGRHSLKVRTDVHRLEHEGFKLRSTLCYIVDASESTTGWSRSEFPDKNTSLLCFYASALSCFHFCPSPENTSSLSKPLHLHCLSLCLQGTQAKRVPMNLLFSTFFFIYFHPLIQTPHTLTQKCIYSNLQAIITLIIERNKTTSWDTRNSRPKL